MSGHLSKAAIAAKRDQLQTRLAQLDQRIHTVEDALDAPHSRDWPEAAKEREDAEALEALGLEAQHEIAMINVAIAGASRNRFHAFVIFIILNKKDLTLNSFRKTMLLHCNNTINY